MPPVAGTTVNTMGTVVPVSAAGGSKATWLRPEIVAKVALVVDTVSAGLIKYRTRSTTEVWPAGIVIVVPVGNGAELVAGAVMLAAEEDGAAIVTLIVNV